jgi:hypothetical protein
MVGGIGTMRVMCAAPSGSKVAESCSVAAGFVCADIDLKSAYARKRINPEVFTRKDVRNGKIRNALCTSVSPVFKV